MAPSSKHRETIDAVVGEDAPSLGLIDRGSDKAESKKERAVFTFALDEDAELPALEALGQCCGATSGDTLAVGDRGRADASATVRSRIYRSIPHAKATRFFMADQLAGDTARFVERNCKFAPRPSFYLAIAAGVPFRTTSSLEVKERVSARSGCYPPSAPSDVKKSARNSDRGLWAPDFRGSCPEGLEFGPSSCCSHCRMRMPPQLWAISRQGIWTAQSIRRNSTVNSAPGRRPQAPVNRLHLLAEHVRFQLRVKGSA
jgi:hypothetical protein